MENKEFSTENGFLLIYTRSTASNLKLDCMHDGEVPLQIALLARFIAAIGEMTDELGLDSTFVQLMSS